MSANLAGDYEKLRKTEEAITAFEETLENLKALKEQTDPLAWELFTRKHSEHFAVTMEKLTTVTRVLLDEANRKLVALEEIFSDGSGK